MNESTNDIRKKGDKKKKIYLSLAKIWLYINHLSPYVIGVVYQLKEKNIIVL